MDLIKSFLVLIGTVTVSALVVSSSNAQGVSSPLVDKQIKKSNATLELQEAWANTAYAPSHDEKLILQNTSRKEVFLNGDLQTTAPSFIEQNGEVIGGATAKQWPADPALEMTEKVYDDQVAAKKKRFYRRALNSQFQQNIKEAGVSGHSRDIAQELDRLELIKKKQLGN